VEVADEGLELRVLVASVEVLRVDFEVVLAAARDDVVGKGELKELLIELGVCRAELEELLVRVRACRAELKKLLLEAVVCRAELDVLLPLIDEDEVVEMVVTGTEEVVEAEVCEVVERSDVEVVEDVGMVADFEESLCEDWEVDVDEELAELEELGA
jgi:hypothetical protein